MVSGVYVERMSSMGERRKSKEAEGNRGKQKEMDCRDAYYYASIIIFLICRTCYGVITNLFSQE